MLFRPLLMQYALANKLLSVAGASGVDITSAISAELNPCDQPSSHYISALLNANHTTRRPHHVLISHWPGVSHTLRLLCSLTLCHLIFPKSRNIHYEMPPSLSNRFPSQASAKSNPYSMCVANDDAGAISDSFHRFFVSS